MDAMHWAMLGLVVGSGSVAAWGWMRWARERAMAAGLEERARRAEEEAGRLAEEVRSGGERERGLEVELVRVEGRLREVEARHEEEVESLGAVMAERERGLFEKEREFKEAMRARDAELRAQFESLAGAVLRANKEELAKTGSVELEKRKEAVERLVGPIGETLRKTEERLRAMEESRVAGFAELKSRMEELGRAGGELRAETGKLVRALREPKVRGMYGEVQLRRVAELAGMRAYCDFAEQESSRDAEGNALRPDMVVRLPSGRVLAVDAKANLMPYLEALDAGTAEAAEEKLEAFAEGIARQVGALSRKEYWRQFEGSPEFVVMFVPGDQFVDAALSRRPELLEAAASQRVLLASPSTLIALLRAVHVGFQELRLAEEARELRALGKELHERASSVMEHVGRLGGSLEKAVEHFNKFVGSYEARLEPTLRRFEEAGAKGGKELVEVKGVSASVRRLEGEEKERT